MKQGTVSVLVGCHSVVHSLWVWRAWIKLYGHPKFWEWVCIMIHDWGHWGKDYLDDLEVKKLHWRAGAFIALKLFGADGFDLCAGHCEYSGFAQSKMYKADKLSQLGYPYVWAWWYLIFEPKLAMGYSKREAYDRFQAQVRDSIESGRWEGTHGFFLRRCKDD